MRPPMPGRRSGGLPTRAASRSGRGSRSLSRPPTPPPRHRHLPPAACSPEPKPAPALPLARPPVARPPQADAPLGAHPVAAATSSVALDGCRGHPRTPPSSPRLPPTPPPPTSRRRCSTAVAHAVAPTAPLLSPAFPLAPPPRATSAQHGVFINSRARSAYGLADRYSIRARRAGRSSSPGRIRMTFARATTRSSSRRPCRPA